MRGDITGTDIIRNARLIYREFKVRCLVRCLWVLATRKRTTLLEMNQAMLSGSEADRADVED